MCKLRTHPDGVTAEVCLMLARVAIDIVLFLTWVMVVIIIQFAI